MRKCRLQKTISFLLSFVMVLGMCVIAVPPKTARAEGVQFTVNASRTGELRKGDTFDVTVSMSGNTQGYGLEYELGFDKTILEPVGEPKAGAVFNGSLIDAPNVAWDKKSIMAAPVRGAVLENGELMTVTFRVLESATAGQINFTYRAELFAEYGDALPTPGNTGNVNLNIVVPVLTLSESKLDMTAGQEKQLTATLAPDDGNSAITWKSDNTAVATVSNDGKVSAVSGGSATITATDTVSGASASCAVNVTVPITAITIKEKDVKVSRGQTTSPLRVEYTPEGTTEEKEVEWKSSDETVATVDSTGAVTGVKRGTATITATATKAALQPSADITVTVEEKNMDEELAEDIVFSEMEEPILKGNQGQTVNMLDFLNIEKFMKDNQITDTYSIAWSSSEEKVATVDSDGKVTGVKEGKAVITAEITFTDGEGKETAKVKVPTEIEVKEIPLESIAFDKIIKEMMVGTTETLSVIYNPDNTTDLRDVKWESSDSSILTVENGKVTALKAGEAEVTATVGDKKASCKITVKDGSETLKPGQDKNDGKGTGTTGKKDAKTNSPKTGDMANVALYAVLLLLSIGAVLFVYKRRTDRVRR